MKPGESSSSLDCKANCAPAAKAREGIGSLSESDPGLEFQSYWGSEPL